MADINDTHDVYAPDGAAQNVEAGQETPTTLGGAARMLGAVISLVLVAGVGVWSYKLVVRDVSGVPVVRALGGPMRIQPADPGGSQADHQGLAVNAVAADGTAAPTADRVMLAPGPIELTDEDAPLDQIATREGPVSDAPGDPAVASQDLSELSVDALVAQLTGQSETTETASDDNAAATPDVQPEVLTTQQAAIEDEAQDPADYQASLVTGPGLTKSLRPQARPARAVASDGGAAILDSALDGAVDAAALIEVDPESLAVGTRLAQLGAYDNIDLARADWTRLTLKFKDYFDGKQRVIQKASSGGRTFYRLRAMGFDELSEARRFCSALVSENTDCIPVTTR